MKKFLESPLLLAETWGWGIKAVFLSIHSKIIIIIQFRLPIVIGIKAGMLLHSTRIIGINRLGLLLVLKTCNIVQDKKCIILEVRMVWGKDVAKVCTCSGGCSCPRCLIGHDIGRN